jgi:hypothetical protein
VGSIEVGGSRETTAGFVGTDFLGKLITLSTHPIGQTFSALLGKLDVLPPTPGLPETCFFMAAAVRQTRLH